MVKYTEDQQKMAKALLKGPRTSEELRDEVKLPADQVLEALKEMMKLRVVEKTGFPTKYKLIDSIMQRVKDGKEGGFTDKKFEIAMIIEGLSSNRDALEQQMGQLKEKIGQEKGIEIIQLEVQEIMQHESNYTTYIDLHFGADSFATVITMIIQYGPSSVEVIEPRNASLGVGEMQASLNEVVSAVHYYIGLVVQLKQAMGKMAQNQQQTGNAPENGGKRGET